MRSAGKLTRGGRCGQFCKDTACTYLVLEHCASTLGCRIPPRSQDAHSHYDIPSDATVELHARWARELLESLRFIHSKRVVHCDLKPSNLLIRRDDTYARTPQG